MVNHPSLPFGGGGDGGGGGGGGGSGCGGGGVVGGLVCQSISQSECHNKFTRESWDIMRNSCANHEQVMRKSWARHN